MGWFDRLSKRQSVLAVLAKEDEMRRREFPTVESWIDSIPKCDVQLPIAESADHLESDLTDILALLESLGEQYWWDWLQVARRRLRERPQDGARYFMGAFSGAHSFHLPPILLPPMGAERLIQASSVKAEIYKLQRSAFRHARSIIDQSE